MFGCHAVANVVVCTRIESRVSRGLGREQLNESLKALVGYLDQGLLGTLVTIGAITEDGALSDAEKVASIRALLATRQTQRLLQKNQVAMLKEALVRFVESAINQVVSKRMVKKQQMGWSQRGAHLLLQIRTRVLDEEWENTFRRWYPDFRPQGQAEKAA